MVKQRCFTANQIILIENAMDLMMKSLMMKIRKMNNKMRNMFFRNFFIVLIASNFALYGSQKAPSSSAVTEQQSHSNSLRKCPCDIQSWLDQAKALPFQIISRLAKVPS